MDGALSKFADGSNAEALNCAAHTRTLKTHKYTQYLPEVKVLSDIFEPG